MIVPGSANALLLRSARGYQINQSLRFRASNSAFLSYTEKAGTSRRIQTVSVWAKRGTLAGNETLFFWRDTGASPFTYDCVFFDNSARLAIFGYIDNSTLVYDLRSTRVFRDPSAWYHIVVAYDTTQATAANRVRAWVNGEEITSWSSASYPAQNTDLQFGVLNNVAYIGRQELATGTNAYYDGYNAEVVRVDGQALTPSSFGQTDPTTGAWVPKRYTGTYGTNGFYLPFDDATSTTTISQDRSGNGNNWTSSGISVTAGVTMDQVIDSPTSGAAGTRPVGNYAVLNPLLNNSGTTFRWANLEHSSQATGAHRTGAGSITLPTTGKWYWEVTACRSVNNEMIGVANIQNNPQLPASGTEIGNGSRGDYGYRSDATKYNNGSQGAYGATYTNGDVIGVAWDSDAGTLTFFKNGVSQGTAFSSITQVEGRFAPASSNAETGYDVFNFGQRPFAYTPPTGFVALCTANLSTPTIQNGATAFQATLRTGSNSQVIVSGLAFGPNLVWTKDRVAANFHNVADSVRGPNLNLATNSTTAEDTVGRLTAFNSDGYTLAGNFSNTNIAGSNYVDWAWREGAAYGFDIVTYTGNATNRTIAHGLNAVPHLMIAKERSPNTNDWSVYHRNANANPQNGALFLNLTDAFTSNVLYWNNTAPTSSVFSLGAGNGTNRNLATYVAYLWTSIPGFSLFGSYVGNGSTDGPFVWCGFRPRWVLIKRVNSSGSSWILQDAARSPSNVVDDGLFPDLANAEGVNESTIALDFTASGFKLRTTGTAVNESGSTYIFAAFAETPFKFANGR